MSDTAVSSVVTEAIERFDLCVEAEAKQRTREIEDLKFQVPELQWPTEVADQRRAQTVNGIALAARPMLSIPKLDQPIQLVLNQEKAAHLGVQVHALTEDATDDTAEVLQGLYRAIEVDSRANLARSWAFERAVKCGTGAYRILKEYDDTSDHPSDQKIVLKRIYQQGAVYFDPSASEPDASDAQYAFVIEDVPLRTYKRRYPTSTIASYSDEEFVALGNAREGWVSGDGEARAVRVCEYFYLQYEDEHIDWEGGSRVRQKPVVHWCTLNAVEALDTEIWDGRYIPLIRVVGRELIPFDGEPRRVGIISTNKDAQRLFNYAASASVEMAALETKASHALDPEQVEGFEAWWAQKNVRNFPYLPYRRMVNGQDLGPPVPIQADMSKMQVNALLLQQAGDFIHAGTFAYEPTLGAQSSNVHSGRQALALQQQHDDGNSHWLDNLAEISLTHEARCVLDLIPKVYDRPGRVVRMLDGEDTPKQVMLNAPFTLQNKRPRAVDPRALAMQGASGDVKHYDLTKGRYGVTVSVGKAYKSRVEQGKDELGQLFQAEPELFKILGDIYLKFADFPGHREAADRVKKMLPPQLQQQDGQLDPRAELDQAKAALAQMQQQLQELQPEKLKAQVQVITAQSKAKTDENIARMNNATKIAVARITAAKASLDAQAEDQEEAIALNLQLAHDATEGELDRQHERDTLAAQQVLEQTKLQHAADQATADRQHDAGLAAASAGQDAAMADKGHAQALEQGQQGIHGQIAVAKSKPQPTSTKA